MFDLRIGSTNTSIKILVASKEEKARRNLENVKFVNFWVRIFLSQDTNISDAITDSVFWKGYVH